MNNLSRYTILVALHLGCPGFRKPDRNAGRKLAADMDTSEDAWAVSKILFPHDPLKALRQFDRKFRDWFNLATAPFTEGMRITRITYLETLQQGFRERRQERDGLVQAFAEPGAYMGHIQQAKAARNGDFSPSDYPDPEDLDFTCKLVPLPTPDAGHLVLDVAAEVQADLRAGVKEQLEAARREARLADYAKLAGPLIKLAGRVRAFPTLWAEMREINAILQANNVTGDPHLEALRAATEQLMATHNPQVCDESKDAAAAANLAARDILKRMQSLLPAP